MTSAAASSRAGTAVWLLTRLAIQIFYRVRRIGATLPDGPALLVANHPNSLLDPALVQATAGRRIRFLAKSTLFQGHLLSPLIRRSGAIPVHRRIDPGTDMSRNAEMFAAVEAVLGQGDVVCLFPKGVSHSTGRLEQLRTGAARIALSSSANGVCVAIVPTGLNFDRLAVFRSRVTVVFGQPFGFDDLASAYQDNPQAAVRMLTMRIEECLRWLMIEADPRGDLRMVDRIYRLYSAARGVSRAEADRLQRRRIIAAGIERLRLNEPERYRSIQDKVLEYDARRARFGLRERDVDQRISTRTAMRFTRREALLAALLGPLALLSVLLFAVPCWITGLVGRQVRALESRATWQLVGGLLNYAAWMGLLAAAVWLAYGAVTAPAAFFLLSILARSLGCSPSNEKQQSSEPCEYSWPSDIHRSKPTPA